MYKKLDNDRILFFALIFLLNMLPTIIIRHRKENLQKCSLRNLEKREDFRFYSYPLRTQPDLSNYLLLTIDAPPLNKEDAKYGIFLIDATWRYAEAMEKNIAFPDTMIKRSLPANYTTAYPRKQTHCAFPDQGLASIEALFVAFQILGREAEGLLDHYYWRELFLKKNSFS